MKSDRWITANEVIVRYDLTRNSIYVKKDKHWIKKKKVFPYKNIRTFVNISFLERVKAFRQKTFEEATDLYYELSEHYTDYGLARALSDEKHTQASWNHFIRYVLFKPEWDRSTILDTRVSKMVILFVRRTRRIHAGIKRDQRQQNEEVA